MQFSLRPFSGAAVLAATVALSACGGGGAPATPAANPNGVETTQPAQVAVLNLARFTPLSNGSTQTRVEVPISMHKTSTGDTFMTVPITVGSTTLEAILDTGSPGLRVLPGAIQPADYQAVTPATASRIDYGGGDLVQGIAAQAVVKVGAASTNEPIRFTLVNQVSCVPTKPNCDARDGDAQNYRFLQETHLSGKGYKAILGVSLRGASAVTDGVYSPLAQIGRTTFIVRITNENGPGTGRLIVNPEAQDDIGWARFDVPRDVPEDLPNGLAAWRDHALQGCLYNRTAGRRHCAYLMIDSGAPRITVVTNEVSVATGYAAGASVDLALHQDAQHALQSASFYTTTLDPVGGNAAMVHLQPRGAADLQNHMIWGAMAFRQFDVMYSQVGGFVALRGH